MECFLTLVERAEPGAVFDIGANVGLYGLLAKAYSDRTVHCFEPAPGTRDVAARTGAENGLDIVVSDIALSNENGTATLYLSDQTDASNSLNPEFRKHTKEITVPVETTDEYVERTGVRPVVLKVDTETTEPEVLAGASGYIEAQRPWIMCEVLRGRGEDRLHAVMDRFGYSYYHLNGPGPRPAAEQIEGDAIGTNYMYLFAPHPVDDAFWERMNQWAEVLSAATLELPPPEPAPDDPGTQPQPPPRSEAPEKPSDQ